MKKENKKQSNVRFYGGPNVALKIPGNKFHATCHFYQRTLKIPLIKRGNKSWAFRFGKNILWIDKISKNRKPEIWLEIQTPHLIECEHYLNEKKVKRRDEVEKLPNALKAFWIQNPAGQIHLVYQPNRR